MFANQTARQTASQSPYQSGQRPLRVALLAHDGGLYGAERALLRLAIGLARRPDFRPLVVLPYAGPLYRRCHEYGIETAVVDYPAGLLNAPESPRTGGLLRYYLRAWRPLLARLKRFSPDVIYSNTAANPLGALAARRLGIGHTWHLQELAGPACVRLPAWPLLRWLLRSERSHLVGNSEATAQHYASLLGRDGIRVIYNGLDFSPEPQLSGEQRYRLRIQDSAVIDLLVVAGLQDNKGHEDALRATALLRRQGLPVRLNLAGFGESDYVERLKTKVRAYNLQDATRFMGFVDPTGPLYQKAALTLVCGRAEGFGRSAVESMAWGAPVVGSSAGALPEIIRDRRTGLLYPAGQWRALAACIRELIESPELYAQLSATGVDWVRQRFPARRYVREMAQLLTGAAITGRPRLRSIYRDQITALPSASFSGKQV